MQRTVWSLVIVLSASTAAVAQPAPTTLTADAASRIIEGCARHAEAKGQSHAIAVVDAGGHPVAFLRMERNSAGAGDFALEKARAAASWRFSTAEMERAVEETPGFASAPHVVTVPGGVPVSLGRRRVPRCRASGEAPSDDAACVGGRHRGSRSARVPASRTFLRAAAGAGNPGRRLGSGSRRCRGRRRGADG
ncbi:MAG: heme-binding protein [Thermoanaerobaculia bacterium]